MNVTLNTAINLLETGYSIIPIGDNKKPTIQWKESQTKPITPAELEGFSKWDKFRMYGACTGYNGLECVDVDLKIFKNLPQAEQFWAEFIGMLRDHIDDFDSKFVIYKTQNSGYHIIYRCNTPGGNNKIAKIKDHKEAIIETRGVGGYIIIYTNKKSTLGYDQVQLIDDDDRNALMSICQYFNYVEQVDATIEKKPAGAATVPIGDNKTPWQDYNERTTAFDVVGDEFEIVKDLKDKIIIKRHGAESAHSGYIYKDSGLMYLFSTGTIYPHEQPLSPFSLYAHKYHQGNHKEAAKDLYTKGFGSRLAPKPQKLSKAPQLPKDPTFPVDIFPVEIQNYLIENNKTLNFSYDYMGCALLWTIALIIGNSIKIEVKKGWLEAPNIWIAVIGKAGIGKTHSINTIIRPLNKKNSFEIKQYYKQLKKFEAYKELSKEQKRYAEEVDMPSRKQMIVGDITLEALVELHQESKMSVGVFKDELAGWVKDMNKYREGGDLEFWLSSWSNQVAMSNRKVSKNSFIDSPVIPVLGGVQPSIFNIFATDENKENGFIDRLLPCFPEMVIDKWTDNEMTQDIIDYYEHEITGFYDQIRKTAMLDQEGDVVPFIAKFDKEAKKEWVLVFNKITNIQNSEDETEYTKSMLAKMKSYVPRFALLVNSINAYFKNQTLTVISKDSVLAAEKLYEYFYHMSKKIKATSADVKDLRKLVSKYEGKSNSEIIKKVAQAMPDFNKKDLAEILNVSRTAIYKHLANKP